MSGKAKGLDIAVVVDIATEGGGNTGDGTSIHTTDISANNGNGATGFADTKLNYKMNMILLLLYSTLDGFQQKSK